MDGRRSLEAAAERLEGFARRRLALLREHQAGRVDLDAPFTASCPGCPCRPPSGRSAWATCWPTPAGSSRGWKAPRHRPWRPWPSARRPRDADPDPPLHAGDRPGRGTLPGELAPLVGTYAAWNLWTPELRVRPDAAGTGLALVWPTGDEDPLTALSATPASAWATTRPAPSGPGSRPWSRAAPYSWWCPAGRSTGSTDAAHPTT